MTINKQNTQFLYQLKARAKEYSTDYNLFFLALQLYALCEHSSSSNCGPPPRTLPNDSLDHSGSPTIPSIINWKITSEYKGLRSLSFIGSPGVWYSLRTQEILPLHMHPAAFSDSMAFHSSSSCLRLSTFLTEPSGLRQYFLTPIFLLFAAFVSFIGSTLNIRFRAGLNSSSLTKPFKLTFYRGFKKSI